MVDPQASQFGRAALRSGLLDAKALADCFAAIPEDRRTDDAIDRRLARQSIALGHLSIWQAQQVLSGRTLGFKIDKYVLVDMLGQGGMGRVYLARDTRLGRNVALKVLSRERMNNPRAIARFQREAKVGAQLQHENLVRVYDEGQAQNVRYLVMEYIEGSNIGRFVSENGPLPWPLAARLIRGVALGLDHAFKKGLVHRDVNPFNILVTHDGTAKLTDLGLAFDLADEGNVTRDGATVGTFDYVSPEQARDSHSVDTRADIYSLGCTFYHLLVGRPPFPMPSLPEKLIAHQTREPEPIRQFAPNVPEGLVAIVARMIRKLPEDRYATPKEVVDALEPFASAEASTALAAAESIADLSRDSQQSLATDPFAEANQNASNGATGKTSGRDRDVNLSTLDLDFGPEPGLTEGLSVGGRGKPRVRSNSQSSSDDGTGSGERAPRSSKKRLVIGVVAVLFVITTLLSLIKPGGMGQNKKKAEAAGPETASSSRPNDATGTAPADTSRSSAGSAKTQNATSQAQLAADPKAPPSILVVLPDGSSEPAPDLATAVAKALGGRGSIVLGDRTPLRLSTTQPLRIQGGSLVIRAATGTSPTLQIDDAGAASLFEGASNSTIALRGLRLVANYAKKLPAAAPLIVSGGPISLDHCIIQGVGETGGSTAIRGLGAGVKIEHSLIDGFDKGLDVLAPPGAEVTLRQFIFVKPHVNEGPVGWAVCLVNQPAGLGPNRNKPRRLILDQCTIKGEGAFQFQGFGPETGLNVEIHASAIQAKSLLAWLPANPNGPRKIEPKSLKWSGKENRYHILGDAWVVFSPVASLALPGTPTNLKTWTSLYPEVDSLDNAFALNAELSSLPPDRPADPTDYAMKGEPVPPHAGADPKQVGPTIQTPR